MKTTLFLSMALLLACAQPESQQTAADAPQAGTPQAGTPQAAAPAVPQGPAPKALVLDFRTKTTLDAAALAEVQAWFLEKSTSSLQKVAPVDRTALEQSLGDAGTMVGDWGMTPYMATRMLLDSGVDYVLGSGLFDNPERPGEVLLVMALYSVAGSSEGNFAPMPALEIPRRSVPADAGSIKKGLSDMLDELNASPAAL